VACGYVSSVAYVFLADQERDKIFTAAFASHISGHVSNRPARADLVATVGEMGPAAVLERLRQRMLADPEGRRILQERPIVTVSTAVGNGMCGILWYGTSNLLLPITFNHGVAA
jgi:hypothetical protein